MQNSEPRCWGYRIDTHYIPFFWKEIQNGRLRQGWGFDPGQDLRKKTLNRKGARRNERMFHEVKKGHLLLVPRLPDWGQVSIVEATKDWCDGYSFEIPEHGDHGHIFPAKFLNSFVRGNEHVSGAIRATLRTPSRFWNIDHLLSDIRRLHSTEDDLCSWSSPADRTENIATEVSQELLRDFDEEMFKRLNHDLEGKDWEHALQAVLRMRYPSAGVDIVQGRSEAHHGTDILVRLPNITGDLRWAIAVQVKDHEGHVDTSGIRQIGKADHWNMKGIKVIQKVVIFTRAARSENPEAVEAAKADGVEILFGEELQELVGDWGRRHAARALLE